MPPIEITSELYLFPLDMKLKGFTSFIGAWLYRGAKTVLVDPGPAATLPALIRALEELGISSLDVILLTHIHLDHAGGVGDLLKRFPDTPVVCHQSGIKHLADPQRLWEVSLKTIADTARAYGPLKPVSTALLCDAVTYKSHTILPIPTPGHAPHHVSYAIGRYLFVGEAAGVYVALPDGKFYLRPSTPPRFFFETGIRSLQNLLEISHDLCCFGHFGASPNGADLLNAHIDQLQRWKEVIQSEIEYGRREDFYERCLNRLMREDPLMAGWNQLGEDLQARERLFLTNGVRGFEGYLENQS
ncbi:MAG: MBL fold metallo-hydrolase [Desulfobacterales bacterium]